MQVGIPTAPPLSATAATTTEPSARRPDVPTRPAYLRDVAAIEAELAQLAAAHPTHARLVDIGDSARKVRGEATGHDVLALVLGAHADDRSVPRVLLTAGVHPRETANHDVLLRWSRRTLESAAAGDPARAALLARRTVVVVPLLNPDSHDDVVAGLEAGDAARIWRRGNDGDTGHVDLNRNFDNRWGAGATDPHDQNYRGPAPASEPEVQALQRFARELAPRGVYDVHSPGQVVLAPAGIPDARAAAELVARATGYEVSSSSQHWHKPVGGGTVKDWAHDQLGAVSLTIETGDVHHQDDAQHAETLARMLPALDALVATVDGHHAPPPGAEVLLGRPTPEPRSISVAHG